MCWCFLMLVVAGGGWQPAISGVCTAPAWAGVRLRGGASAGSGGSNSTSADTADHVETNAVSAFGVQGRVDYERLIRDWGSQVGFFPPHAVRRVLRWNGTLNAGMIAADK